MRHENGRPAAPAADSTAGALEEYLAAVAAGAAPPREEFLARHPELAEDLDACLAALRLIGRAAQGPLSAVGGGDVLPPAGADSGPVSGVLGDFRIVREVGRGGMGVVYEAEQVSLGRRVALKVLPFAAMMDPRQLQRFHNEARAAASLDHPHIVHVHAVGSERAVHFYAMQFIDGQTLADLIAGRRQRGGRPALPEAQPTTPHVPGQPTPAAPSAETAPRAAASTERAAPDPTYFRRVAELGVQAAEALDHAHQLGIVHRDVKPANLLLDGRGGRWVTDFGLSHIQSDVRLTMTGDLVGTLRYMSPEQALAKRVVVDHRTDVYSLGATLYELLTLEPAFGGGDRQELLRQIAFEEPKPPRRVDKATPAELETIVLKALEKNPADRYATAKELADDLRRWLADEPIRARAAGAVRRLRKWGRRHQAAVVAAVVVLALGLVLLSGAGGWLVQRRAAAEAEALRTLDEAESWQQQGRWPEARAAARRAEGLLTGGGGRAELRQRVSTLLDDLAMVERLEAIRLQECRVRDEHFDTTGADAAYAEAFRDYGVDVEALGSAAGERIRERSIRVELAAALDNWAMTRQKSYGEADCTWQAMLAAARVADADPLRTHVRRALETGSKAQLVQLADAVTSADWPATTLDLVGVMLRDVGATQQAVAVLRAGQDRYPGDFWLNHDLAYVLATNVKPPQREEAIRFYTAAIALRPQSPGVYLNLGEALREHGRQHEAVAAYRKAIALMPEYSMAHVNLGIVLGQMGRLDEAVAALRRAIELKPDSAGAHANLGTALDNLGRWDEAVVSHRQAIALRPDNTEAYHNLGVTLGKLDRPDEARAAFHMVEVINASREARLRNSDGAADFAREAANYAKLIRVTPDDKRLWLSLWEAEFRSKQFDTALRRYARAIEQGPDGAFGWAGRGVTFCELGEWAKASADFSRALVLKDAPDWVWYFRALLCLRAGDADGYRKVCASMRERWGTSSGLALWTCVMAPNAVDDPMAVANGVVNGMGSEPRAHWAANLLGTALYRAGRYDAAAGQLARASTLNPDPYRTNMIYAWFYLAMTHHQLGHAQEARQWLDKAILATDVALSPSPPTATGRASDATDPAGGIPPNWHRTLTLQLFRREASELLKIEAGDPKPAPSQREVP